MITIGKISLDHLGAIPGGASLQDFAKSFQFAAWCQRSSPFWIGDLLVEAELRFGDEIYNELGGSWSVEAIDRWVGVARNVPRSLRVAGLSWSHHAAVSRVPMPWKRELLLEAKAKSWTSTELRKVVSQKRGEWASAGSAGVSSGRRRQSRPEPGHGADGPENRGAGS